MKYHTSCHDCGICFLSKLQRDGCPKIINLGSRRMDLHFDKKRYGFSVRWPIWCTAECPTPTSKAIETEKVGLINDNLPSAADFFLSLSFDDVTISNNTHSAIHRIKMYGENGWNEAMQLCVQSLATCSSLSSLYLGACTNEITSCTAYIMSSSFPWASQSSRNARGGAWQR